MCNYTILAHNRSGYVILCQSCRHYQLAFGTTAVTFEPQDFKRFCAQVALLNNSESNDGFELQKRISIDLFLKTAMMVLSHKELLELSELLSQATFELELQGICKELNLVIR